MPAKKSNRRSRKEKIDLRGLPDRATLVDLAKSYLNIQQEHADKLGIVVPKATQATLDRMVDRYIRRYHEDETIKVEADCDLKHAAVYLRYSDANSNPRSLIQQLEKTLPRAAEEGYFVPWELVFADAALTATTADRPGYQLAKEAITGKEAVCRVLIVEEIGRVARVAVEALELARLITMFDGRMIGVSDHFDSNESDSKLRLMIYAMLNEWFIEQLRCKVYRGMDDAFAEGKVVQRPCFGYGLEPLRDEDGEPVFNEMGRVVNQRTIDEENAKIVREVYSRYAAGESSNAIARDLNARKIGPKTWDGTKVRQLLRRDIYRGFEHRNRVRHVKDPKTGEITTIKRPKKEWQRREMLHLRLIEPNVIESVDRRLEETAKAYSSRKPSTESRSRSRKRLYPTTLIRPICGNCGSEMALARGGEYRNFWCHNGLTGKHGCTHRGTKSVRIVENAILSHLRDAVFTEQFLAKLIVETNRQLEQLPEPDSGRLDDVRGQLDEACTRLKTLQEALEDGDLSDCETLLKTISRLEKKRNRLRQEEAELLARENPQPLALTEDELAEALSDLRGVLGEDVQTAAPLLDRMLGDVVITQREVEGFAKPQWFASFTLNGAAVVSHLTRQQDYPNSGVSEFRSAANWTIGEAHEICLREPTVYERLAPQALAYKSKGFSTQWIAEKLGVCWKVADDSIRFAETGERPEPEKPRKRKPRSSSDTTTMPKYKLHSGEVVRLRDEERWTFERIATHLDIAPKTVKRAYDFGTDGQTTMEDGRRDRGNWRHLDSDTIAVVHRLLREGRAVKDVANMTGASESTVRREMSAMD